ncbi:MAG: N-acetyltransferase [Bacteroidales bacterium]|nr:N-acetyltransferase [Bacteroidales bacterium]
MKVHPSADVQSTMIGENTTIWQFSIVLPGAVIGDNCNINSHCFIENNVTIGNNVTVKCGVYLWDGITIEDEVHIGPNVTFTNDLYPRSKHPFKLAETIVRSGASIGANATIIPGITIGEFALIGAGSVVTKDIPNNTLWVGNPARQTAYVCNCGQKLDKDLHCRVCNIDYLIVNYRLTRR